MKKRLSIVGIIVIALFVCFSGCQENNSNNEDKNISGFSTYEDIENGFSIEYPATWNKYENPSQVQDVNVLFTSPSNEPTKTGNLMVSVFADVNMTMDDFKNAHVENLSLLLLDYNLISEESITFLGLLGYEITFTFTNDIFTWRQLEVWTIDENTLYLLVHQADQAFYENFADDIEYMILSFKIVE